MQILSFDEDFLPRFSFEENRSRYRNRRRTSSCCNIPISIPFSLSNDVSKTNLSYGRLPQQPIMLIIRKLDGSSFEVEVAMTATVAELKQAVEAVFYDKPKKGHGKISWSHVWGHFCLSYDGWKLVTDCEPIRNYGIRDGDQLTFTRQISITFNLKRRNSKMSSSMSNRKSVNMKSEDSDYDDDEKETTKETEEEEDYKQQQQQRPKKRYMFRFGKFEETLAAEALAAALSKVEEALTTSLF
ncbi:uncharacterized protein LOC124930555 [Impatiens glandulifera]|uniref:uncharacterized protein LOC124930555 n=1 Tax=Impatiens glandulifera TaxID=253017 RepID=UPI001FB0B03F|nr:uncharacterized protein LOC124930555 [Impatiens glandulifera]